ncbi:MULTISPECIES: trypsin-like serine peptidase [Streptomyces]|uniref:trypsin-like serine peptidase n=1 Tax=Streptomyces TaxID=1883 RepID=UPI001F3BC146|nr:serine protease [Streptomyces sp. AMCC400023]UJV44438.1 hypothetical protein CVT30_35505 [Streptomyces sp. AMCC400023]
MQRHRHGENPWRVRVDDDSGRPRGAGVLLDGRHVLTCAHVVAEAGASPDTADAHVRVTSAVCRPEWSVTARIEPGEWVYRNRTRRGDVALLRLDEPAPCDGGTRLWQAPVSGGRVRVYGFPRLEENGIGVDAEMAGSGSREGEWAQLNPVHGGRPWIERGFSGSGVVALDGDFAGRVVGIVVADFVDGDARAAWMLPTETMRGYLPGLEPYVQGAPTACLLPAGAAPPHHGLDDPLRLTLTQELVRLLSGGWSGTVVLTGGATETGTSWLVRLVRTADPVARAAISDLELSTAPRHTVLRLGSVDAAYDARGRTTAQVRHYLADRFGFPHDAADLLHRLTHRTPPVCLVLARVDRSAEPESLLRDLLRPLALRARTRGVRLVLGFDAAPPPGLPYEVALGSDMVDHPVDEDSPGPVPREDACETVERLSGAEDDASSLYARWGLSFLPSPRLPPRRAPQLRVRLAVAKGPGAHAELAAIAAAARSALREVAGAERELGRLVGRYDDLLHELEVHRVRARDAFGAEDAGLAARYGSATGPLRTVPVDLKAAQTAVAQYRDEVHRRIEQARRDSRGEV